MNEEDKDKVAKEDEIKIGETQSEGDKQPVDESKEINETKSIISKQESLETNKSEKEKEERRVIHKRDGRLHIYVRLDKYKGEIKSKNWVGRLYIDGKQKISSSGTPNLEDNGRDKFLRYKINYQHGPSREPGAHFALYKTKKKWNQESQNWTIEYEKEFVRDFLVDMEFVVTDRDGKIIDPPPTPFNSTSNKLYFINSVDIKLTFKSKNELFSKIPESSKPRLVQGLGNAITNRAMEFFDKFFRDSIIVTVHTRNIGGNI